MNERDHDQAQELSYEVGLERRGQKPSVASFKLKGPIMSFRRELSVDDDVQVIVTDADGEIILSTLGVVRGIHFKKHKGTERRPSYVERIHSISLGESSDPDEDMQR